MGRFGSSNHYTDGRSYGQLKLTGQRQRAALVRLPEPVMATLLVGFSSGAEAAN
jgi:hypothetical protein